MPRTTSNSLTASEIMQIMEAAAKHGVTEFQVGDLRFTTSGYRPQLSAQAQAMQELYEEDRAAQDWATAEPPPPVPESM